MDKYEEIQKAIDSIRIEMLRLEAIITQIKNQNPDSGLSRTIMDKKKTEK
jgi:hypothetical protein